MQITVTLFAAAKEAANSDTINVEVSDSATAGDVLDAIGNQMPELNPLLSSSRLAVDCSYVGRDASVSSESDVALIPPVSGG